MQSKEEAEETEHDDMDERSGHEADVSDGGVAVKTRRKGSSAASYGKKVIGKLSSNKRDNPIDRIHLLRSELERLEQLPKQSAFAKHRRLMVTKALDLLAKANRTTRESESLTVLMEKLKF